MSRQKHAYYQRNRNEEKPRKYPSLPHTITPKSTKNSTSSSKNWLVVFKLMKISQLFIFIQFKRLSFVELKFVYFALNMKGPNTSFRFRLPGTIFFIPYRTIRGVVMLALFFSLGQVQGQNGGRYTYEFLELPLSARQAGLGGVMVPTRDYDVANGIFNPSTLNKEHHKQLSLNYCDFASDINYGMIGTGYHFGKIGTLGLGLQYINYGKFTQANATSEKLGTFSAGEYALIGGWGMPIDSQLSVGLGSKIIYSALYDRQSFGMAFDLSGSYQLKEHYFSAGFLARNIGFQIKPYSSGNREPLPLKVQAGVSKGFAHLPLRLSLILTNLQQGDLSFTDPNDQNNVDPLTGEISDEGPGIGKKIMLHTAFHAEFTITKYINLRFGYNFKRRDELKISTRPGMAGLSLGGGLKISKFIINYGRMFYHLSGSGNYFSVAMNLDEFKKKAKP
jgi:hypothetical protein